MGDPNEELQVHKDKDANSDVGKNLPCFFGAGRLVMSIFPDNLTRILCWPHLGLDGFSLDGVFKEGYFHVSGHF